MSDFDRYDGCLDAYLTRKPASRSVRKVASIAAAAAKRWGKPTALPWQQWVHGTLPTPFITSGGAVILGDADEGETFPAFVERMAAQGLAEMAVPDVRAEALSRLAELDANLILDGD